ncbi:MAG: pentapeptide repeat-containing protein [Terriglobia bacterium]
MRLRTIVNTLLFMTLLCLWAPLRASGQQQKDSTWQDKQGHVRSRADLDEILDAHKQWVESQFEGSHLNTGARADLSGINLSYAEFDGMNLWGANFEGSILIGAKLRGAILGPLGQGNQQHSTVLGGWRPAAPVLLGGTAYVNGQPTVTVHSPVTDLKGAYLHEADLSGADVSYADLTGAVLERANLSHAILTGADLTRALLIDTDLDTSDVRGANLLGAIFEPRSVSRIKGIASAANLEFVTYRDNPGPLTELRKQFQDAGYREQERKITYALNREEARRGPFVERWFKRVAFDLTCKYGLTPGRPLRIVLFLWLFFSCVYAGFMHQPGPSGIYFVGSRLWRGKSNTQGVQIRPIAIGSAKGWRHPFPWLRREWRVLRAAMFFSLMSAFNISFRDINFGRWLRMLTTREYDLKAVGWARTVSGFQSLLSVYLIALWVLAYFGRPFG